MVATTMDNWTMMCLGREGSLVALSDDEGLLSATIANKLKQVNFTSYARFRYSAY